VALKRSLDVTLDWLGKQEQVGQLQIYEVRGKEAYRFMYSRWAIDNPHSFALDPDLEPIYGLPYESRSLWGAFADISPDRWGRLVQSRAHGGHLTDSDYMVGVSDYMRMGALRLSDIDAPGIYLADHKKVPKLTSLRALEEATRRIEHGKETDDDMQLLLAPGSSLGGAHPKASVEDRGQLYIAKFQSRNDTSRLSAWEATMLDMAQIAGISVANHRLINQDSDTPILLVERFDRRGAARIPFSSAMTMTGLRDGSTEGSYLLIADTIKQMSVQPTVDQHELWKRMVFSVLAGNTDDHLRNHGFIRRLEGWQLSPAYDLNPTRISFEKRSHALSFDGDRLRPSLDTCMDLAPYFGVDDYQAQAMIAQIGKSLSSWAMAAQKNGLRADEIKDMSVSFEHRDTERAMHISTDYKTRQRPKQRR